MVATATAATQQQRGQRAEQRHERHGPPSRRPRRRLRGAARRPRRRRGERGGGGTTATGRVSVSVSAAGRGIRTGAVSSAHGSAYDVDRGVSRGGDVGRRRIRRPSASSHRRVRGQTGLRGQGSGQRIPDDRHLAARCSSPARASRRRRRPRSRWPATAPVQRGSRCTHRRLLGAANDRRDLVIRLEVEEGRRSSLTAPSPGRRHAWRGRLPMRRRRG